MFWAPGPVFGILRASGPIFMFCAPRSIFGGTEGVRSRFHVLRSQTHFLRYRGRRVSFSSFKLQDPFLTVPTASSLVFMFCATKPVFGSTEGVGSRFHVLRSRTHFRWYRGRRVLFSCFALQDPFSAVPMASGSVFMLCAPGHFFSETEGVGSHFLVLRSLTHFRRYRRRRVPFSCFAL
jgi:hypothetical protein